MIASGLLSHKGLLIMSCWHKVNWWSSSNVHVTVKSLAKQDVLIVPVQEYYVQLLCLIRDWGMLQWTYICHRGTWWWSIRTSCYFCILYVDVNNSLCSDMWGSHNYWPVLLYITAQISIVWKIVLTNLIWKSYIITRLSTMTFGFYPLLNL